MTGPDTCPPDHKHGLTLTCTTNHGCRCEDCTTALRDYLFWRRHMIAAGHTGRLNSIVPATGTRRRIQALMTLGWSQAALAAHLGCRQQLLSDALQGDNVRRTTRDRIATAYEPLSVRRPPADTTGQRMSVNRTIALATRRGWAGPFDWDDIDNDPTPATALAAEDDIDDVDVVAVELALGGSRVHLTTEERRLAVVQLHGRHHSDQQIAVLLGCSDKTIIRDRNHLGLPAAVGQDRRPIAA